MKQIPILGLQRGKSISKAGSMEEEFIELPYSLGYLSALSRKLQWEYSGTPTPAF